MARVAFTGWYGTSGAQAQKNPKRKTFGVLLVYLRSELARHRHIAVGLH
jgi:hypothetical protein